MPPRPASLKVRALQWLAQREHSPQDLRNKLLRIAAARSPSGPGDCDADDAAAVQQVDMLMAWLSANGHLSAQRFVDGRIHVRQARYGNRRIEQELRQHGLALDAGAQQALRDSELARAREVWRRKYGAIATDAAGRVRQMRFLVSRGFSPEVVRRVVRDGESDER